MRQIPDKRAEPVASDSYDDRFFDQITAQSLSSAEVIAPIVQRLVGARSVVDVGCGRGAWLKAFQANGAQTVQGYDGDYVDRQKLLINPASFQPANLTEGISISGRYDLALCLEVGEHLPSRQAQGLVAALTRAASVVLFSAAVPNQGGTGHINEQWPAYWEHLFAQRGFVKIDAVRPHIFGHPQVAWWYQQNIVVYVSEAALAASERLQQAREGAPGPWHEWYHWKVLRPHQSVAGLWSELRKAIARAIRRRLDVMRFTRRQGRHT